MPRKTKAKQPSAPGTNYMEWKASVRTEMRRREIPAIYLRERDVRNLFVANATPEEAAERAAVEAHNMRPSFGRRGRR